MDSSKKIEKALREYYTDFYREKLGLADWESRVDQRLQEEETFGEPIVRKVEYWLDYRFQGKKILVVGTGTGAEVMALSRREGMIYGIDPSPAALAILRLKAAQYRLDPESFLLAKAEAIPFPDDSFDFVFCYTVLEHVQDVERAIDEMIRVCRPNGLVFLALPEYRFPSEPHYKMWLIPFAPRWFHAIYLKALGRPTAYLRTLNFLTRPKLDRMLWKKNVITIRINEPLLRQWKKISYQYIFSVIFAILPQQNIFLRKMPSN
jgi:ubiquinone/menaquinone biosynthesis C-methylase UbiE